MVDKFSPEKRSEIMSLIKSKNTKPEVITFAYLRSEKIYFKKHYYRAPVNIDIAQPRKKKAVFIDGDFWHGRTFERRKDKLPAFWAAKIIRNIKRDRIYRTDLRSKGWKILRIWESDVMSKRSREETLGKIKFFLLSN
jgi:DNA mismatch endonuclease (patch repair protein)